MLITPRLWLAPLALLTRAGRLEVMSVSDYWRILHLQTCAGSNLTAPSGTLKHSWDERNRCGALLMGKQQRWDGPALRLLFPPFYLLFLFSFSPFLSTISTLFPPTLSSFIPIRRFLPISSSQVELCSTELRFMPCTVQWVACQALRVQGSSPGTDALAGAQAPVACALVSWQSS